MNTALDILGTAGAWVAGLAAHGQTVLAPLPHDATRHELRMARIELYCAHEDAALLALRRARGTLAAEDPQAVPLLAALDEAAWHIRHHAPGDAHQVLEAARDRLA